MPSILMYSTADKVCRVCGSVLHTGAALPHGWPSALSMKLDVSVVVLTDDQAT